MTAIIRVFSTASGLLMVALAAAGSHGPAAGAQALGVIAVLAGTVYRPAATLAVLFSVAAMVLSNQLSPVLAACSGLSAASYLVARYAHRGPTGVVTTPTIVAAVGFTFVGVVAASFPLQLAWLPLLAPPAVLGIYVLATRPFLE
ncbi:hypothetical protein MSM1_03130 [Mycobacterium sp. SM1]|uniref:hypothetical protein n=1 Tax=Mycobacterium sp. SM1 TaxID=2816243 RepID=UPI001BCEFAD2|nr:hypothetical protein [Mycobacterium sp. SM1]MBS4727394.1 hypothetical protein [Mycobacterium sp. SM1]